MPESWTLKVKRAEHHFQELRRELAAFSNDHRFEVIPVDPLPRCREHGGRCWDYQLHMTRQPGPQLAVIAGDVLFNLRSALDHIAVAMVPSKFRREASFPIEVMPIWVRDNRRFVIRDPEGRRRFRSATKGMPTGAITIIERLQPYHGRNEGPEQEALYQLSRLNNADKHRQLVTFAGGLLNMICDVNAAGAFTRKVHRNSKPGIPFARDGQHVLHFSSDAGRVRKSDVKVQVTGTPVVGIKIEAPYGRDKRAGFIGLEELLTLLIQHIGTGILPTLEPYVRRRA
jgi:hypothetical protein